MAYNETKEIRGSGIGEERGRGDEDLGRVYEEGGREESDRN